MIARLRTDFFGGACVHDVIIYRYSHHKGLVGGIGVRYVPLFRDVIFAFFFVVRVGKDVFYLVVYRSSGIAVASFAVTVKF